MRELIETDQEEEQTWAIRPNKSQIKRDISVLSDLCEEIAQVPFEHLVQSSFCEEFHIVDIDPDSHLSHDSIPHCANFSL